MAMAMAMALTLALTLASASETSQVTISYHRTPGAAHNTAQHSTHNSNKTDMRKSRRGRQLDRRKQEYCTSRYTMCVSYCIHTIATKATIGAMVPWMHAPRLEGGGDIHRCLLSSTAVLYLELFDELPGELPAGEGRVVTLIVEKERS